MKKKRNNLFNDLIINCLYCYYLVKDKFFQFFIFILFKKEELRVKIENIFTDNAKKLSQKLEIFSNKLEKSEKVKNNII